MHVMQHAGFAVLFLLLQLCMLVVDGIEQKEVVWQSRVRFGVASPAVFNTPGTMMYVVSKIGIVIALNESVQLTTKGGNHHLAPGSTMLIPFSAGAFTLEGSALLARPPLP